MALRNKLTYFVYKLHFMYHIHNLLSQVQTSMTPPGVCGAPCPQTLHYLGRQRTRLDMVGN